MHLGSCGKAQGCSDLYALIGPKKPIGKVNDCSDRLYDPEQPGSISGSRLACSAAGPSAALQTSISTLSSVLVELHGLIKRMLRCQDCPNGVHLPAKQQPGNSISIDKRARHLYVLRLICPLTGTPVGVLLLPDSGVNGCTPT